MSYAKFRDMVELCGHLQARSMGLTITELMQLTERSRKTVERMLGTLIGLGLVEANHMRDSDHHLTKRWRLEGSANAPIHLFMNIEPLEKVALERLLISLDGGPAQRGLTKMLSVQKPLSRHLVNDLDEFIERDAHIGKLVLVALVSRLSFQIEFLPQGFQLSLRLDLLFLKLRGGVRRGVGVTEIQKEGIRLRLRLSPSSGSSCQHRHRQSHLQPRHLERVHFLQFLQLGHLGFQRLWGGSRPLMITCATSIYHTLTRA